MALSGVAGLSTMPARFPCGADRLQRPVRMRARLDMDHDRVGARLGEGLDIRVGRRDHQMRVERPFRMRPDGGDDRAGRS